MKKLMCLFLFIFIVSLASAADCSKLKFRVKRYDTLLSYYQKELERYYLIKGEYNPPQELADKYVSTWRLYWYYKTLLSDCEENK